MIGKVCFLSVAFLFLCIRGQMVVKMGSNKAFVFNKFMADCPNVDIPTYYRNITIKKQSGFNKYMINYDFHIERDVNLKTLFFRFQKCPSAEALDRCQTLPVFKTSNLCPMMRSEHDPWSPLLTCTTPKFPCPYVKGIYKGRNCSIDMEAFKFFPLNSGFWKLQADISDVEDKIIFCIINEGTVARQ